MDLVKSLVRPAYYAYLKHKINAAATRTRFKDAREIPIIINNRNRLTMLQKLIKSLEIRGYSNIHIIDNNSTYKPLLSYYERSSYVIHRIHQNGGYLSLWKTGLIKKYQQDYFVYTDPDLEIVPECPHDFMQLFFSELKRNKELFKVGFSLRIDDLPDHYQRKQQVIEWEKQFFQKPAGPMFYEAAIDTTFALHKPYMVGGAHKILTAYRSAHPYEMRHLPWYVDSSLPDAEEQYYIAHTETSTHWTLGNNIPGEMNNK